MKYYTTTTAARLLNMSERQVRRYCQRGKLGTRIGRNFAITPDEIEAFVPSPRGRQAASTRD